MPTSSNIEQPPGESPHGETPRSWFSRLNGMLNYDFCPWANRYVYWLKNPFWVLTLAVPIAVACGLYISPYLLILAATITVILLTGVVWPWVAVRGLRCKLRIETQRCRENESAKLRLEITNRWPWPLWGLSLSRGFEMFDDRGNEQSSGVALASISGWSTSEFPWEFTPPSRGVYPLAAPQIESGFPFGLYQAKREVECTDELLVWPDAYNVDCIPEAPDQNTSEEHLSDRRVGDFGDVMGTREFRDGDSLRRVHWAQTARLGRLIVCERQAPTNQLVTVILDARLDDTLEDRIRIVAGIAESLKRMHTTVEVRIGKKRHTVDTRASSLRLLLDELARIPREGIEVGESLAAGRDPTLQILVTSERGFTHSSRTARIGGNRRIVVVHPKASPECDAWIDVAASRELKWGFARQWKRACQFG